jgi:uncharacterized C2H2 Zn-finger protein
MSQFICDRCQKAFKQRYLYVNHLKRKTLCPLKGTEDSNYKCSGCDRIFSRKYHLKRHMEESCPYLKNMPEKSEEITKICKTVSLLQYKVDELEKRQPIQNNLQIVCVNPNENYFDLLSGRMGGFQQALEFIKDCALSRLNGDCRLIEKIYFEQESSSLVSTLPPIRRNKNQTIEYIDSAQKNVIDDPHGVKLCEILANNIQNSYLKGIRIVVNDNDMIKIYESDVDAWRSHIYDLSTYKYQKQLMTTLKIPQS